MRGRIPFALAASSVPAWPEFQIASRQVALFPVNSRSRVGQAECCRAGPGIGKAAKISLGVAFFSTHAKLLSKVVRVLRRSRTVMTDLETKAEKYKTKAAQCKEWALQAPVGPQRDLYEVLARYYGELATNFRQVIEKRKAA
jgi:hypothetical protein